MQEFKDTVSLLRTLRNNIYISIMTDSRKVKNEWIKDEENSRYWTGHASFIRFFDKRDTDKLMELFGEFIYIRKNREFIILKLKN